MSTWLLRLHRHDQRALHALVLRRRLALDRLMRTITHLGDAAAVVAATLALLLVVPGARPAGMRAAAALITSHLAVQLLKRTISRARPRLPTGCASLVRAPDRFSFPSGHSAAALSLVLALVPVLPAGAAAAALFCAVMVGLSRCYLGVHYPGDVLAGWVLAGLGILAADPILRVIG